MKKLLLALIMTFSILLIPQTSHAEWTDVSGVDSWSYVDDRTIILYAYYRPLCVIETYSGTFYSSSKITLPTNQLEEYNNDKNKILVDGREVRIQKISRVGMTQPVKHLK